jgi:hypothetical protein
LQKTISDHPLCAFLQLTTTTNTNEKEQKQKCMIFLRDALKLDGIEFVAHVESEQRRKELKQKHVEIEEKIMMTTTNNNEMIDFGEIIDRDSFVSCFVCLLRLLFFVDTHNNR